MRPEIDLIPMDDIDEKIVEELKRRLKEKGCIVRMYTRAHSPKTAVNLYRKQNNVEVITDALSDLSGKVMAVTDKDIYASRLNFAFHSTVGGGPAIISTHRLRPEFYQEKPSMELTIDRLVKEAVFCIGKMNGLRECKSPRCIMYKVSSARDIDCKSHDFCAECKINNIVDNLRL